MAILAWWSGRQMAYYNGYNKLKHLKTHDNIDNKIYLPLVIISLIITLLIMIWNTIRLPISEGGAFYSGDRYIVILWFVFSVFSFLHGMEGQKYKGHRKYINNFKKERENFFKILSHHDKIYKKEKGELLARRDTVLSAISSKKINMKKNIERVKKYRESFAKFLKQIGKDAESLLQIYYNANQTARADEFDDTKRIKLVKSQMSLKHDDMNRHDKEFKSYESFYKDIASNNHHDKTQKLINDEVKELDNNYLNKMKSFIKQIKSLGSIESKENSKNAYVSSLNNPKKEFDSVIKSINDNFLASISQD